MIRKTRTRLLEIHAHFLRHELHQSNQVLAHFVSVCRAHRKFRYAELVFQQAHFPDLILFNSMIKGYSVSGPFEKSLALFSRMKNSGVLPNEYTLAPLIKSCCNLCDPWVGKGVHNEIIKLGFERHSSVRIGIVEFYANGRRWWMQRRVGEIEKPWNFLMKCKIEGRFELDEASVVTMLPVCARLGAFDVGNWLHSYAQSSGLFRDFVTVGLAFNGKGELGADCLKRCLVELEHYGCMVDLLGRSGCLREAYDLVKNMPMTPNAALWGALLSAARNLGDVQLAEYALKELINLEPENSGNYVLLSNIYAEEGRWDEVDRLRLLMKERSLIYFNGGGETDDFLSDLVTNFC
ncbi:hypothetical protein RDABS01_019774 [Bienertia sinuspersici]